MTWKKRSSQLGCGPDTVLGLIKNVTREVVCEPCAALYLLPDIFWINVWKIHTIGRVMNQCGSLEKRVGKSVSIESQCCACFEDGDRIAFGSASDTLVWQGGVSTKMLHVLT